MTYATIRLTDGSIQRVGPLSDGLSQDAYRALSQTWGNTVLGFDEMSEKPIGFIAPPTDPDFALHEAARIAIPGSSQSVVTALPDSIVSENPPAKKSWLFWGIAIGGLWLLFRG